MCFFFVLSTRKSKKNVNNKFHMTFHFNKHEEIITNHIKIKYRIKRGRNSNLFCCTGRYKVDIDVLSDSTCPKCMCILVIHKTGFDVSAHRLSSIFFKKTDKK